MFSFYCTWIFLSFSFKCGFLKYLYHIKIRRPLQQILLPIVIEFLQLQGLCIQGKFFSVMKYYWLNEEIVRRLDYLEHLEINLLIIGSKFISAWLDLPCWPLKDNLWTSLWLSLYCLIISLIRLLLCLKGTWYSIWILIINFCFKFPKTSKIQHQ